MSKPCWLIKWNRPSKFDPQRKIQELNAFFNENEAKEFYDKLKNDPDVTDLSFQETECCSL